jgi:hypothetical protein
VSWELSVSFPGGPGGDLDQELIAAVGNWPGSSGTWVGPPPVRDMQWTFPTEAEARDALARVQLLEEARNIAAEVYDLEEL